jgi:hypothetical protein
VRFWTIVVKKSAMPNDNWPNLVAAAFRLRSRRGAFAGVCGQTQRLRHPAIRSLKAAATEFDTFQGIIGIMLISGVIIPVSMRYVTNAGFV